jgi:(R,R)-butanediol dehydrogenase / meso-butanediol dehydrogenase / diacetyl reductase
VRIKIAFCGICGTDIHEFLGGPIFLPAKGEKNPHTGAQLPVTLGHEFSGTIVEVGDKVPSIKTGQEIAVNPTLDDRHHGKEPCTRCRAGRPNICQHWACYGLSGPGGGFAEEIVVDYHSVIELPKGVSLRSGALAEPLAVASHMIRLANFKKGDNVLVLGAGPIGLALLLLLKAWGAGKVLVTEIAASRAEKASQFGANEVITAMGPAEGPNEAVLKAVEMSTEEGVDIAFDASGLQSTLDTAVAATRYGGTIFNVAIHEKSLKLNPNNICLLEKRYMGGICYTDEDFHLVLDAIASNKIPADSMITSVVPLSQVIAGGFEELIGRKERHIKILIQPDV